MLRSTNFKKEAPYLIVNIFSTEVLNRENILTSPTGDAPIQGRSQDFSKGGSQRQSSQVDLLGKSEIL